MLLSSLQRRAVRAPSFLNVRRLALQQQEQQLFSSQSAPENANTVAKLPSTIDKSDDTSAPADQKKKAKLPQPPTLPPTTTWSTLVIGEIVAFQPHSEADRLNVCQVNVGDADNLLQIVCGAPNVRQGARVPVAKVGSKLALKDPESGDVKLVKIKKSKLRGEVSQGMICSEAELGLADMSDGILILEDDAPVGSLVQDWGSIASRLVKPSSVELKQEGDKQQ